MQWCRIVGRNTIVVTRQLKAMWLCDDWAMDKRKFINVAGKTLGLTAGAAAAGGLIFWRAAVHKLAKQRRPYRRAWEDAQLGISVDLDRIGQLEAAKRPLIYVALGDSAAQGIGATDVSEGYVARIARGLEEASGRKVLCVNLSVSGGTAITVLGNELAQLRGMGLDGSVLTPDVITMDIGGNDVMMAQLEAKTFGGAVEKILANLPAKAYVANIPSYVIGRWDRRAALFSKHLDEAADKHGHTVIDLRTYSRSLPTWFYLFRRHSADLFHPNSAAYADWAGMFLERICADNGWIPPREDAN